MPLLCFQYGGKWWEMVGKWWEFYQNIRNTFFGERSMEHVRVNRRGGLYHGTLICIHWCSNANHCVSLMSWWEKAWPQAWRRKWALWPCLWRTQLSLL